MSIARRYVAAMALTLPRRPIQTKDNTASCRQCEMLALRISPYLNGLVFPERFVAIAMTGLCRASGDRLNALDHFLIFRTVFVPHRLDRVLERRLVGDLDDLASVSFLLFQRLLFVLLPE